MDESGDPGFKYSKNENTAFVVALVIFEDELVAEETALEIKKLRRELKKNDQFEFKFNKLNKKLRLLFLDRIKSFSFTVRAIVIRKDVIQSSTLRNSKDKFYNFVVKMVLEHSNNTIENAKLRVDGLGEKLFRKNLQSYLKKNLNSESKKILENLRFRDSKKDVLIQLADMVVGAIHRSYDCEKKDSQQYLSLVKKRIQDLWEFK